MARLKHSADFARADASPLIRLGDALVALAELSSVREQLEDQAVLLRRGLEEGYGKALAINRANPEALVGRGVGLGGDVRGETT